MRRKRLKLNECGITQGAVGADECTGQAECAAECTVSATCQEIEEALGGGANSYSDCINAC
jgi:hypothetical protein